MLTKKNYPTITNENDEAALNFTLDSFGVTIKGEKINLPQFIYSPNERFNDAIERDMENLDNSMNGFHEYCLSKTTETSEIIRMYEDLRYNKGSEEIEDEVTVNLMTMLFQIYWNTGDLSDEYYFLLNEMIVHNHFAFSYFLALDWICSDKNDMKQRGFELMFFLAGNDNFFAKDYFRINIDKTAKKS